jgi:hypothetical protein
MTGDTQQRRTVPIDDRSHTRIRKHDWIWTASLDLTACADTNRHRDCLAGAICNFALCFRVDAAAQDAGQDIGALDDGGFAEVAPMDDAAIDALVGDDAGDP